MADDAVSAAVLCGVERTICGGDQSLPVGRIRRADRNPDTDRDGDHLSLPDLISTLQNCHVPERVWSCLWGYPASSREFDPTCGVATSR